MLNYVVDPLLLAPLVPEVPEAPLVPLVPDVPLAPELVLPLDPDEPLLHRKLRHGALVQHCSSVLHVSPALRHIGMSASTEASPFVSETQTFV